MLLKNKNIILTGSSGILGSKLSQKLLDEGANIALIDIDKTGLVNLKKNLKIKNGQKVIIFNIDITYEEDVKRTISEVYSIFGSIDVLFNNAASKGPSIEKFLAPFEDYEISTWNSVFNVNLTGMFLLSREVIKFMKEQKQGSIIQTGSIYGVVSPKNDIYVNSSYNGNEINTPAVYSVSKSAVIGLTKYLASYLGPFNIRVNSISPGGIFSGQNDEFVKNYSNKVPLGRMASPQDIFGIAVFLASEQSSYLTGQNILVDGGFSL